MKTTIIRSILLTQCVCALYAQDIQPRPLTENETAEVKQKLKSFDEGKSTLENLTDNPEAAMKLIEYYLSPTNDVTTKMKLPIGRSFAIWSQYPKAAQMAQDYVNVYSNDWRGWRLLGGAKVMMKSYDEAIIALTNAEHLGDEKNDLALGIAALAVNRLDTLENIVIPHLLVQINDDKEFSEKQRIQMRGVLIVYALKTDKKEIFIKAVADVDMGTISQWEELKNQVALGCNQFKGEDIDKIRKELDAATESSSSSTATNVPPIQH